MSVHFGYTTVSNQRHDGTLVLEVSSTDDLPRPNVPDNDLSESHIDRALHGDPFDGSYHITGPQMVLVMKLTTFAWNTWDGRRPVEVSSSLTQPLVDLAQRAHIHAGSGQMADENAGYQVPFIARIHRFLVRVSYHSTPPFPAEPSYVDCTFPVSSLARSSNMQHTCL